MNRYSTVLRCVSTAGPILITAKPLFPPHPSHEADPITTVKWPPEEPESNGVDAASGDTSGPARRRPRSPFAVLRGQPSLVGRCAHGLQPKAPAMPEPTPRTSSIASASSTPLPELCACAALVYSNGSVASASTSVGEEAELQAVRDQFLMALKLSPSCEVRLRGCTSESQLATLFNNPSSGSSAKAANAGGGGEVGDMLAARLVTLCNEPPSLSASTTPTRTAAGADAGASDTTSRDWSVRLLLPTEEGSRVRWLHEETANFTGNFHRAPSLRSLAVMVSIQRATNATNDTQRIRRTGAESHTGTGSASEASSTAMNRAAQANGASGNGAGSLSQPIATSVYGSRGDVLLTLDDVLQVEKRMEDRNEEWTMVDLAALAFVAGGDPDVAAHLLRRCAEMLMPNTETTTTTTTNGGNASAGTSAGSATTGDNRHDTDKNGNGAASAATRSRDAYQNGSAAARLQRDLGQIIAGLVLWQQAMYFLDVVMPPAVGDGSDSATPDTAASAPGRRDSAAEATTTRMTSPSAILRERHGLNFHFPVADLLVASSNLIRLHRAYLQSEAAVAEAARQGRGAGGSVRGDDSTAHSLWRSASETARGLFTFSGDDNDQDGATGRGNPGRRGGGGPSSSPLSSLSRTGNATTPDGDVRSDGFGQEEPSLPLPADPTLRSILFQVLHRLYKDVHRLAEETTGVIDDDAYLSAVTGWLLMEAPESYVCARHFRRLVEADPSAALKALERSGLLGRHSPHARMNLHVVVSRLLPLLQHCENEDFYNSAIREVLAGMEDQLRHDPTAFTSGDMEELALLGTQVFAVSASEASHSTTFDASVRGQMEELHVMDGSPWALVVSSYTALKEMVAGLHKDHKKLKQQVQDQMRSMGLMISPTDSSDATSSPPATGTTGVNAAHTAGDGVLPGGLHDATSAAASSAVRAGPQPLRLTVTQTLRHRFLVFLEDLVRDLVDDNRGVEAERPIVVSSALFDFINRQVPVPNIQDEYRRKIFLLVNVAEDPETTRQRELARRKEEEREAEEARRNRSHTTWLTRVLERRVAEKKAQSAKKNPSDADDAHGGVDEIPAELRFLVSSLPLTLSPWASVMILREVLAESAGKNPRYSYVLKAAIDLQLPISTTRSRIATTLNMWRFLNSQSHKLTLKESVLVKQRCAWNLPLSYVLSSYWSLLTSFIVAFLVILNVVGIDFESQLVANTLFQQFAPFEEIDCSDAEDWHKEAATDLASDYLEQDELARKKREQRSSTNVILSSASYLFLGYDDQRRPFTIVPISSDASQATSLDAADRRHAEEYAGAASVLRELSLHVPFPFYMDFERPLPLELLEARVADRIRRVSFNNTWFGPRMIIRTFPLGRQYTEHSLIAHTCAQANLTRRRITFLFYVQDGVPVTETFLKRVMQSQMAQSANLVLVVHERSLRSGGVSVADMERLMDLPPSPQPQLPQPQPGTGPAASSQGATTAGAAAPTPATRLAAWRGYLSSRKSPAPTPMTTSAENGTAAASSSTPSAAAAANGATADGGVPSPAAVDADAAAGQGSPASMRVLPYSRQLYEQGLWFDTVERSRSAGGGLGVGAGAGRRGSGGKGAGAAGAMASDARLSPFARRFRDARRSLWTASSEDPLSGLSSDRDSRGGHGVLNTLWAGVVRPSVQLALLPVTVVVRAVGGSTPPDKEETTDPTHQSNTNTNSNTSPNDGSETVLSPVHGLVSVPSEIFTRTVQGTKNLVNTTRSGLVSGPRRAAASSADGADTAASSAINAAAADLNRAPLKQTWKPSWAQFTQPAVPPTAPATDTVVTGQGFQEADPDPDSANSSPNASPPPSTTTRESLAATVNREVERGTKALRETQSAPLSTRSAAHISNLVQQHMAEQLKQDSGKYVDQELLSHSSTPWWEPLKAAKPW